MSERRKFIKPGSAGELRALIALVNHRSTPEWGTGEGQQWQQIIDLIERSIGMHVIGDAYTELVDDEAILFDPEQRGYFGAAIALSLDRDSLGQLSIGVCLKEIDGGQLTHVLEVARRHELDVREEHGWLRLSPQLIATEDETSDEPEEALA